MAAISSLRVAVFGISRSGKDYTIKKVIETMGALGMNLAHYPGVPTIREYSLSVLGKEFVNTTEEEKGCLMDIFRRNIFDRRKTPFLIQDEHYCYPVLYGGKPLVNEYTAAKFPFKLKKDAGDLREYEVMLEERWIRGCDMIFYLHPDPEEIIERMRNSEGAKRNMQITSEDIFCWMEFEVSSLKEICARYDLCFEILEENNGAYEKITRRICDMVSEPAAVQIRRSQAEPET